MSTATATRAVPQVDLLRRWRRHRARRDRALVTAIYVIAAAIALASFQKIGGVDPLASIGGAQSLYELVLLLISTTLLVVRLAGRLPLRLLLAGPILSGFVYAAYATMTGMWSVEPALSVGKGVELFLLIINGVALGYAIRRDRLHRYFFTYLALAMLIVAVAFLVSNLLLHGSPLYLRTFEDQRTRLWFMSTHPIAVAHLGSLGVLCTLLSNLGWLPKLATVGFFRWILYLADARASVIGVALSLLVLVTTRNRSGTTLGLGLLYLFLFLTAVASVAGWVIMTNDELLQLLPPDVTSLNGRVGLWGTAFEFVVDDPLRTLAGYGYFGSRFLLLSFYQWGGHTHQVLLEILLTTGVIGVGVFLYYLRAVYILAFRAPALMVLLAYLAVVSFDDPVLFQPGVTMVVLTWTVSLVLAAQLRTGSRRVGHARALPPRQSADTGNLAGFPKPRPSPATGSLPGTS